MLDKTKRVLAILMTVVMVFALNSCTKKTVEVIEVPVPPEPKFYNLLPTPDRPDQSAKPLDLGFKEKAEEMYKLNEHTIGWINMPDTTIDDVVMFAPEEADPFYYLRRGFNKAELFEGSYFVHSGAHFNGGREGLSQNTVIYGHSMNDNPDSTLLSQLKKLRDEEFAKKHPYIYFSTLEEDMAWEVFAVFDTHIDFVYNIPDSTPEGFQEIINEARKRSLYDYDFEVTPEDHIVTISTCIYNYEGNNLPYPNSYRYVVMAKLVPVGEKLKKEAIFEKNDDMYRDPYVG